MERKDFLLLVVAAGKEKPLTPVQLQKSLFLISEANLPEAPNPLYEFEPYHYGPFDSGIYADAGILKEEGLVVRTPSDQGDWIETAITSDGLSKATSLEKGLPDATADYIREVVHWVQSQSFSGLLRAIYSAYPRYRENSVFQG